jgi:hypothetical protein
MHPPGGRTTVMKRDENLRDLQQNTRIDGSYFDSSVALAYLLGEDRCPADVLWQQQIVSSRLLECEVWNRINARRLQDSHGDAVRGVIGRIAMIEMVPPVLRRALEPFPTSVRTLDAIHWQPSNLSGLREQVCNLPAMTSGW